MERVSSPLLQPWRRLHAVHRMLKIKESTMPSGGPGRLPETPQRGSPKALTTGGFTTMGVGVASSQYGYLDSPTALVISQLLLGCEEWFRDHRLSQILFYCSMLAQECQWLLISACTAVAKSRLPMSIPRAQIWLQSDSYPLLASRHPCKTSEVWCQ
jgi:hypothetical protein